MARSTYMTFLMMKATDSETWEKVVDIKDFPDLGGEPELLETTTLSDDMQTFIPGIQTLDALSFTANYTKTDYAKVKALEGVEHEYAIWMGGTKNVGAAPTPTGTEGKYAFSGQASVYINGGGVNEVTDMTITIAASTPIAPADEA